MLNLRARTLRLAVERPELRSGLVATLGTMTLAERAVITAADDSELLRAVEAAGNTSIIQQPPIIIQQPPIVVQVNSTPAIQAIFVTERTQKGFESDLLPEMERLRGAGSTPAEVAAHILGLIREAFRAKNHLYNILIRHQATFESDAEYRESLERLVQAWVSNTANYGA